MKSFTAVVLAVVCFMVLVSGSEAGMCGACKTAITRINSAAESDPAAFLRSALNGECNKLPRFLIRPTCKKALSAVASGIEGILEISDAPYNSDRICSVVC